MFVGCFRYYCRLGETTVSDVGESALMFQTQTPLTLDLEKIRASGNSTVKEEFEVLWGDSATKDADGDTANGAGGAENAGGAGEGEGEGAAAGADTAAEGLPQALTAADDEDYDDEVHLKEEIEAGEAETGASAIAAQRRKMEKERLEGKVHRMMLVLLLVLPLVLSC